MALRAGLMDLIREEERVLKRKGHEGRKGGDLAAG